MWPLILDCVVATLLLLTIVTALLLNRRLGSLHREKANLQALVNDLATMSGRAESAVASLRLTAEQSGRALLQSVERGEKLSTDLHFVIDRGNSVADRLDQSLRVARPENRREMPAEMAAARQNEKELERSDRQRGDPRAPEERPSEGVRGSQARAADPRPSDARPSDPRAGTARPGEGRPDAREAEAKSSRPKRAVTGVNRSATILGQLYGETILEEGTAAPEAPSRAERDLLRALDERR